MFRFLMIALFLATTTAFSASQPIVPTRRAVVTLKEATAKAAWLAKLDQPEFGARALTIEKKTAAVQVPEPMDESISEDAAKIAWLAKLEQPKLGLVSEVAAKAAWIKKVDESKWVGKVMPTGAAAEAESEMEPVLVASEDAEAAAKAAWLAKIEQD